ncbi:hypothetical protein KY359_05295 [Candidatus Woesearchaeota archaeon]|nr:hypothetical protein [Candidatus Woesearchaeota archaeon]
MNFASKVRKGKVTFVKDMGKELNEIKDAAILANQIDLELKALDQELQEMIHYILDAQTKTGVDTGKVKVFLDTWGDLINKGVAGFDKESQLHVAFTALREQFGKLTDVFTKEPLNGAAQREWLQTMGKTAAQISTLVDVAIENSHEIAIIEMKLAERVKNFKRII